MKIELEMTNKEFDELIGKKQPGDQFSINIRGNEMEFIINSTKRSTISNFKEGSVVDSASLRASAVYSGINV